jgi:hypothetical protein
MMHLFADGTEVGCLYHRNPYAGRYLAIANAQEWADNHQVSVEIWNYEGHETIDDGELAAIVHPQPLQLGLLPGADVVIDEVDP